MDEQKAMRLAEAKIALYEDTMEDLQETMYLMDDTDFYDYANIGDFI